MEAKMPKPTFLLTSQGYINLALVTHISVHGADEASMRFAFSNDYSVDLPREEGEKIVKWLEENHPDVFFKLLGF
jgi:hypothetical protein